MTSSWSVTTLRRIVNDLAPFQEGTSIPLDIIDSFSVSLELVCRELLAKQLVNGSVTVAEIIDNREGGGIGNAHIMLY